MSTNKANDDCQEDFQMLRNYKAVVEIIPFVYKKILELCCAKEDNQTYMEYLNENVTSKEEKKWVKNNQEKLRNTSCPDGDVSFLFSMISNVCRNIIKPGTPEYEKAIKDPSSVEYLLKETKSQRNDVIHEKDKRSCPLIFDTIISTLNNLIESVSSRFKISDHLIANYKREFKDLHEEIKGIDLMGKKKIKYLSKMIVDLGWHERKIVWEKNCSNIRSPFTNSSPLQRSSVYHDVSLSYVRRVAGNTKRDIINFPGSKLFCSTDNSLKIVQGLPGSGKTTLMKTVIENWLDVGDHLSSFEGLDAFDLLVLLECRTNSSKTFPQLLKNNFPQSLSLISDDDIRKAIHLLKILVIVDGYDEMKIESDSLFQEIIEMSSNSNSITVAVTTRPLAGSDLLKSINSREMNFDNITIEGFNDRSDQLEFIERYQEGLNAGESPKATLGIIGAFKQLPPDVAEIFMYPILLAMFCYLCEGNASVSKLWTNESHVFEAVYQLTKDKMKQRISDTTDLRGSDLRSCVDKLMLQLGKLCLQLVHDKCYFLTESRYIQFCNLCRVHVNDCINYDDVLSAILSPESSVLEGNRNTYHFFHSSAQEFFAAKYLCQQLCNIQKLSHGILTAKVIADEVLPTRAPIKEWKQ